MGNWLICPLSRFARNTADALASVREMKSLGVTVAFEKENFDTETSNGEMILSMICSVAQEESLSISKNMKWGIRKRMQDGKYLNGMSPFGYEKQESQLIPIEDEAKTVRYIYNSFLAGIGTIQIAEELNRRYPKENGRWYVSAVRRILMNEKYIGNPTSLNIIKLLLPFKYPMKLDTEYLGGISTSIWMWSGYTSASIIFTFFHSHSFLSISPISFRFCP